MAYSSTDPHLSRFAIRPLEVGIAAGRYFVKLSNWKGKTMKRIMLAVVALGVAIVAVTPAYACNDVPRSQWAQCVIDLSQRSTHDG